MHEFAPAAAVNLSPRRQRCSAFLHAATLLKALGLDGPLTNATLTAGAKHCGNCGNTLRHLHMGIASGPVPEAGLTALTLHCTALESFCCYCDGNEAESDEIQQFVTAQRGLLSLSCAGQATAHSCRRYS
jgi:hypothetical protein